MTWTELSVDCLKEIFTVFASLPEPELQALRPAAARARVTREVSGTVERERERVAVGRTGTTSYGLTSL